MPIPASPIYFLSIYFLSKPFPDNVARHKPCLAQNPKIWFVFVLAGLHWARPDILIPKLIRFHCSILLPKLRLYFESWKVSYDRLNLLLSFQQTYNNSSAMQENAIQSKPTKQTHYATKLENPHHNLQSRVLRRHNFLQV